MKSKRVLVVGLGNMGMSHALAYARIPEFQVVGVCTRRIADKTLPDALAGAKRYSNYEQALAELTARCRVDQHASRHARGLRDQGDGGRRARVRREAARRDGRRCGARGGNGEPHGAETGHWLHPPPAPILDKVHRDREAARHAARLPHEPQSAVEWRDLGVAQAADGLIPAHRRLRRPLRRHHVPDDLGAAGSRPCARRPPDRRGCRLQLRHAAGRVRRRLGWVVRSGMGPDDERNGVLREGRDWPEGFGVDRHGRDGRQREVGRHQRAYQDEPDSLAPRRHDQARRANRHDGRAGSRCALRTRAALSVEGDRRGRGSLRPHERRGQEPEDCAGGRSVGAHRRRGRAL